MCILISTTDHPEYPLILCSNRDEFFARPTQLATVRDLENGTQILSPLDLGRQEHGTWIGVTSQGKVAMLLNYREKKWTTSKVSRGILPVEYLTSSLNDEDWYNTLNDNLTASFSTGDPVNLGDIGGFTLIYGKLETDPKLGRLVPLNIMSNRGDRGRIHVSSEGATDPHFEIAQLSQFSVSNALYYEPWPKTKLGNSKLANVVASAIEKSYTQAELAEACFGVLSHDTYDRAISEKINLFSEAKISELRNSIFIPPLNTTGDDTESEGPNCKSKFYGTRTQTVIMYHRSGKLHYYERDLHDDDSETQRVKNQHFEFDLNKTA